MKKINWIILPIALSAAVGLRLFQLYVAIDDETGFSIDNNISNIFLFLILIIASVTIWIINRKNNITENFEIKKDFVSALLSTAITASLGYYSATYFINHFETIKNFVPTEEGETAEKKIIIIAIVTFISIIPWFMITFSHYLGKNTILNIAVIYAIIPAWLITRILLSFMNYTAVADISSNLFDILAMSTLLYLTYHLTKIFADFESIKSRKSIVHWSMISILFVAISSVSTYYSISNENNKINPPAYPFAITDVLIVLYCLWFVIKQQKNIKNR